MSTSVPLPAVERRRLLPVLDEVERVERVERVSARSVRISVTDRCDFACTYCRPSRDDGYVETRLDLEAWRTLVEGLAEFYSLETLRRSGSISEQRHQDALRREVQWARRSTTLFAKSSTGATTARAVVALRAVDAEIRGATAGKASLDDVARKLASEGGTVSLVRLQKIAQEVAGRPLRSLQREQLSKPVSGPTAERDG